MKQDDHSFDEEEPSSPRDLTLVANPSDIVSALKRNNRDRDTRQTHLIRFPRPLEGRVEAGSILCHQEGHYWPTDTPPLTLKPEEFIQDMIPYPSAADVQESAKDVDGVDNLDDVSDETLNECWRVALEVWENEVRHHLAGEVNINESSSFSDDEPCTIPVEYEG